MKRTWSYFNGESCTDFTTGKSVYVPMTAAYCADCAPDHLPGYDKEKRRGQEHYDTGFRCAPWRIGRPCSHCGKEI